MKTKLLLSIVGLLIFTIRSHGQHCSFDNTRICIISVDDSLLKQTGKIEIFLVDSVGNELLSTSLKKKQYLNDHAPKKLASSRFFYFGTAGNLRKGDFYFSLSQKKTVDPADFFMAMLDKDIKDLFDTYGNLQVQLRSRKRNDPAILAQVKIDVSDFHLGCISVPHWHSQVTKKAIEARIK